MSRLAKLKALASNTFLVGIVVQLVTMLPFLWLTSHWEVHKRMYLDPHMSADLLPLVPGAILRLTIGTVLGGLMMTVFYFFEWRRKRNLSLKEILITTVFSFCFYLFLASRLMQFPVCVDDAYIDFRYVYKWVNGLGFDYNDGERVLGFTSNFHLILLSVFSGLFCRDDIPLVSQVVNVVLQAANYLLLYITMRRAFQSDVMATFSAIIFALGSHNLGQCVAGKEGPLVNILITLSLYGGMTERFHLQTWSSALLLMTRPEGIVWCACTLLYQLKQKGRKVLLLWIAPAAVIALMYVATFAYFGTIFPHGAKGRATMFGTIVEPTDKASFYILKQAGLETFVNAIACVFAPGLDLDVCWALQGCIAFLLFFELGRRYDWLRLYSYNCIALLLFFAVFDPWMFSWYYSWFSLMAPIMVPIIAATLFNLAFSLKRYPSLAFLSILVCLCVSNAFIAQMPPGRVFISHRTGLKGTWWPIFIKLRSYPFGWSMAHERLSYYKLVAMYLATQQVGNGRIATWEPGVVGYLLPRNRILDLGGLVSDEALKYYPLPVGERSRLRVWGGIPPRAIEELKPEWLLFFDCFADNGLIMNRKFLSSYDLEKYWFINIWGSRGMFLYRKAETTAVSP